MAIANPYFIGDQPGGTQTSGWYNAWTPEPSVYAVAARSARDVVAVVNFARNHNLRLVVKGGGHSYQGTSSASDSLLIWTRAMNDIALHDSFVPSGCTTAPVPAVTVGAGAMWVDAYDAVTTRGGRYVQGGGCMSVGVAGLIQSGGFGTFSKRYGLAAASLLEAEVVTADGRLRTVNACRDPDLFWGLKGGGGGSLGVVTKVTLRTYELPDSFGYATGTIKAVSDADFQRLLSRFVEFYAESLFNPHWGEGITVTPDNSLEIHMASQGLSTDAAQKVWRPFLDAIRADSGLHEYRFDIGSGRARSYWDVQAMREMGSRQIISDTRPGASPIHAWWRGDQAEVGIYLYGYDSMWLPRSLLTEKHRAEFVRALFDASRAMLVRLHFNKGLAGSTPDIQAAARDTAINPEVLDAFALAIIATGGAPRYPGQPSSPRDRMAPAHEARAVDRATATLRALAPDAGSYVAESNFFNPRWQRAFWGVNYPRLARVKAKYDPEALFFVHHGVGSENWDADGFTRRT